MTDIQFLNISKIFKLAQSSQRVERQYQNLNIFESANKIQTFDFEVRKIGELQNRWVFNVEFFYIKVISAFKQQILIQLIEER